MAFAPQRRPGSQPGLRELIARLIDDAKAYARAELAVVKLTALGWIAPAKVAVPLAIAALFLVQAALTILVAALGMALAHWLGIAGGLAVAAVLAILLAGLLVWLAMARFKDAP